MQNDLNRLSMIRKYFFETVVLSLSVCVVTLFYMYKDLTIYIRETLTEQTIQMRIAIEENTKTLNETNSLINKNK